MESSAVAKTVLAILELDLVCLSLLHFCFLLVGLLVDIG